MTPDPDLQLQVVLTALQDVVMPAIDPVQSTAIEQLGLSIATLAMLRTRLPHIAARAWVDLADAVALGRGALSVTGQAGLAEAISSAQRLLDTPCPIAGALDRSRGLLLSAISAAIDAADGDRIGELARLVIAGSKSSTDMARAWSAPAGFEPEPSEVHDLAAIIADRIGDAGKDGEPTRSFERSHHD